MEIRIGTVTNHRVVDTNVAPPLWDCCIGKSLQQDMLVINGMRAQVEMTTGPSIRVLYSCFLGTCQRKELMVVREGKVAYDGKKDNNCRDDQPSVKSGSSDIVVLAPPPMKPLLDDVVE